MIQINRLGWFDINQFGLSIIENTFSSTRLSNNKFISRQFLCRDMKVQYNKPQIFDNITDLV